MQGTYMEKAGKVLVTGGGGFIEGTFGGRSSAGWTPGNSCGRLRTSLPVVSGLPPAENICADLRQLSACRAAAHDVRYVFNLAADMDGIGFIETHKAKCMLSVLISTHVLMAAQEASVGTLFYSSSACAYAAEKQTPGRRRSPA